MSQNAAKRPSGPKKAWFRTPKGRCVFAMAVGCMVICLILCLANVPVRYDISVGQESPTTIFATKDVTDKTTLELEQTRAADYVMPFYHIPKEDVDYVMADLTAVLDELQLVQSSQTEVKSNISDAELDEAVARVKRFSLNNNQAAALLNMSNDTFGEERGLILDITRDYLAGMESIQSDSAGTVTAQIIEKVQSQAKSTVLLGILTDESTHVLQDVLSAYWAKNDDATEAARQAARDKVEPRVYQQGAVLIRQGDKVQQNQYDMVLSLGLLKDSPIDASIYYGAALFGIVGYVLLTVLILLLSPALFTDLRRTIVLNCLIVLTVALCVAAVKLIHVYLSPVILAALLCTSLLGWRTAIAANVSIAVVLASLAAGDSSTSLSEMVSIILMTLASGTFCVVFVRHRYQRVLVLACGLVCGLLNALVLLMMSLLTTLLPSTVTGLVTYAVYVLVGSLLSSIIAVGFQPIFESVFNLPTGNKLLELTNPNHPLLKKLMMEAPGTYHHSIIVANLSEAAAENIGANPLLARAGAYFHDVGKLSRPEYFKENQVDTNPLDAVDPYVSAALVTAHTRDGVQLGAKYRLPQEIQQIIGEHHGDTPVMYFYNKALKTAGDKQVDIADFRYPGPRPSSREAGIVMLADTAEAAVRSIQNPTPQSIRERIDTLVRGKLEDGQLSDCPMTMRDIEGVCEAFCKVLNGVFHERIEYPKTDIPQRGTFLSQEESQPQEAAPKPAEFTPKPLVAAETPEEPAAGRDAQAPEAHVPKEPESKNTVGIWPVPPEDLSFTKENP